VAPLSITSQGGYDLAVVGAGSAGFSAAIAAAEIGAQVALIGHAMIGGTCVNVGCVPSKTMIRVAEALHGASAAARFPGLAGEACVTDWPALIAACAFHPHPIGRSSDIRSVVPGYPVTPSWYHHQLAIEQPAVWKFCAGVIMHPGIPF
jgi:hypothetical protein